MAHSEFPVKIRQHSALRLPLEGVIDLTYRCNNNCRHCWVVVQNTEKERRRELATQEWIDIIDQARAMGTREWAISGGEPLLREDFTELFPHIIAKASYYSINTNGTLITPAIAGLFKKKHGSIMVSIYGATADVHDHITRNPGSFDAAVRGITYLREADVPFLVQLVPIKDNFSQWGEMKSLAQRLGPSWRVGAGKLILSASGNTAKNEEIISQRLLPEQAIEINPPNIPYGERKRRESGSGGDRDKRTYDHCLSERDSFHIDPYGSMSFCCFIKEERLRYDLRKGDFAEAWDSFLPSLSEVEQDCLVFDDTCRSCELQGRCQKCPGVSYLEHRHTTQPSPYLCRITKEEDRYRQNWLARHRRFFQIAGITIEVNSEREFRDDSFSPAVNAFAVSEPGDDIIQLEHFFSMPPWEEESLGQLKYQQIPWMIYNLGGTWTYLGYHEDGDVRNLYTLAVFSNRYTHGRIFFDSDYHFNRGSMYSVAMLTTDQIWLAHPLLLRQAFYVHSCGLIVDGRGYLFVGHSQAGKSTIAKLFAGQAELLCDDRNIVRHWPDQGWQVHGTWSHGELEEVSPASAPLRGVFFLEKSQENTLTPIADRMEIRKRLFPCLPRPFVDAEWWEKMWPLVSKLADGVPAYILRFDKSGAIVTKIKELQN